MKLLLTGWIVSMGNSAGLEAMDAAAHIKGGHGGGNVSKKG
jgi:hypothetical protein